MIYSYSSIATYEQCPAKFNFAYKLKTDVPDFPPSTAMERGSAIHDSVEAFFKGTNEMLHPDIHKNYGQFMFSLREEGGRIEPEYKWGVTWEFEPCEYDDPKCMLHGYIDLLILPEEGGDIPIYEWKTGGMYVQDHRKQGHTYAIAMLASFPEYDGADVTITYFDHQDYDKTHYPSSMMFEYKPMLRRQIGKIADTTVYPEMPSFKCKWCKFSRFNGGPCKSG